LFVGAEDEDCLLRLSDGFGALLTTSGAMAMAKAFLCSGFFPRTIARDDDGLMLLLFSA
jgi:hypothetical protein